MMKCTTCGGVYSAVQADGARYFHVCPDLSDAETGVALGVGGDPTKWTAPQKLAIAAAPRARPNARNENALDAATLAPAIAAVKIDDATKYWKTVNALRESSIVAAGAGVTTV